MAGMPQNETQSYVEVTPTVDTSAYASGDLVGTKMEFGSAVLGDDGIKLQGGMIQSVIVTDLGKQSSSLDIVFFDADPSNTTFTDNAALDVDDADLVNVIGVVPITDWHAFSDNSAGQALNLAIPFVVDEGATLYAAIVSRGTPTYVSASDLTVRVGVLLTW